MNPRRALTFEQLKNALAVCIVLCAVAVAGYFVVSAFAAAYIAMGPGVFGASAAFVLFACAFPWAVIRLLR